MEKSSHKNQIEAHTRKKILFCIVLVAILMNISMVFAGDWFDFDNYKTFDENIGDYGKITIFDKNLFGEDNKLQEVELKTNSEICHNDNCKATKQIIIYEPGVLIKDIRFLDTRENKKVNIKNYQFYIVDEEKKTPYELGKEVEAGTYEISLEGELKPFQSVDWQILIGNVFWTDEWAEWSSALNRDLLAYYNFNEGQGSTLTDVFEGVYDGILKNNPTWNVTGKIGGGLEFDGASSQNVSITPRFIFGNNFTISFWIRPELADNRRIFSNQRVVSTWVLLDSSKRIVFDVNADADASVTSGVISDILNGDWWNILVRYNGTRQDIFINGVFNKSTGNTGSADNNAGTAVFGSSESGGGGTFFDGGMDEVGVWNRSLSQAEIDQIYNSGSGITFAIIDTITTLDSPLNDTNNATEPMQFKATITPITTGNLTNATIRIYDSSGDLINETVNIVKGNSTNSTIFDISNLKVDILSWNVLGCSNTTTKSSCTYATNNLTVNYGFEKVFLKFNSTAIETSNQNFILNLNIIEGFNIQKASLIYNNTIFSGATITGSGNNFNITRAIIIPQGNQGFSGQNRTFIFNVTLAEDITGDTFTFLIGEDNQTVTELSFGFCDGADLDVPMLNFTFVDELDGLEINASNNRTTFQTTFRIGLSSGNLIKNLSINNISSNISRYDFCTSETTNNFVVDMLLFYTAQGYTDKDYILDSAPLSNATNEINLFLINENIGVEFFINIEQNLFPLVEATISIAKFFVGEGVFKTVEIDITNGDGKISSFLDLNKDYRFTITKDGELLGILNKRAICEAAPCTLTLSITDETPDIYSGFSEIFAGQVAYNLSFDGGTRIVTFEFVDLTGLATSFRMDITKGIPNGTGTLISRQELFTSSGSIIYDATNDTGDFTATIFITRSPITFIDFIKFLTSNIGIELGILGLFVAFLIVITVIFGFAFSPRMFIFAIPLSLTLVKLMGIISLSNGAITVIYLLAIVAATFISR